MPFEQIIDARNAAPIIRIAEIPLRLANKRRLTDLDLPDAEDLEPRVSSMASGSARIISLVFFGEKTSLGEVLSPLAEESRRRPLSAEPARSATPCLHTMAKTGAEDGREMIVLVMRRL